MEQDYLLSAKNVDKSFTSYNGKQKVLDDISINVSTGEFVCLIGPSGCGKSTLLRLFSGLMKSDHGSIKIKTGAKLSFVIPKLWAFSMAYGRAKYWFWTQDEWRK